MKVLSALFLVLYQGVFSSIALGETKDEVVAKVLEAYPFEFGACETNDAITNACAAPAGLEQLTVSSSINIEVILDVSGSMAGAINGKPKYEIATKALQEFVAILPGYVNLALRVYGHQGSNKKSDREFSCNSTSLVYPFQPVDPEAFMESVHSYQPTGWTALGLSLQQALLDFNRYDAEKNNNIIYLLTDGIETCDGDPEAAAAAITNSNVKAVVNVIGFDLSNKDAGAIRRISEAGGGKYFEASNLQQLVSVFTDEISWREWRYYVECRWTLANRHIREVQEIEQQRINCVMDLADENTSRIEAVIIEKHAELESEVMLEIFKARESAEQPHYDRYSSDEQFNSYVRELEEIERIREMLDSK